MFQNLPGYGQTWGQGQLLRQFQENPQGRDQLRDTIQGIAQGFFNRNPQTAVMPPPPPPPPKTDYTPFIIAAAATILAAVIISKK